MLKKILKIFSKVGKPYLLKLKNSKKLDIEETSREEDKNQDFPQSWLGEISTSKTNFNQFNDRTSDVETAILNKKVDSKPVTGSLLRCRSCKDVKSFYSETCINCGGNNWV